MLDGLCDLHNMLVMDGCWMCERTNGSVGLCFEGLSKVLCCACCDWCVSDVSAWLSIYTGFWVARAVDT